MGTIAKITAGGTTHLVASSAYGTCSTAANTVAKVVTMTDFDTLIAGMTIHVYMTNSNTAASPTLNVNSKGAKPIYKYGTTVPGTTAATSWQAGSIVSFTYNTTANTNGCWIMNDHLDDNNTTYSSKTAASGGTDVSLVTTGEKYTWNNKTSNTGTVTKVSTGTGLTGGDITTTGTISLAGGVVTAGSAGPTAAVTGNDGTTVAIPRITVDEYGRVTNLTSYNLTNKNTVTTDTNNRRAFYGTCATAAATKDKVVTLSNATGWELLPGTIVGVKFTYTNTYASATDNPITLNVNNTGAKNIWYNTTHSGAGNTGAATQIYGVANRYTFYMYDGTYWVWINYGVLDGNTNTVPTAYSTTVAGTAAKVATCTNYNLLAKSYTILLISTTNTAASALTLNINSKGAKPIYINGTASSASNHTMPAGSYLVYYDGTNYYIRTDGKITGDITGNAATVGGHTVGVNVPSSAVFTDTQSDWNVTDTASKAFIKNKPAIESHFTVSLASSSWSSSTTTVNGTPYYTASVTASSLVKEYPIISCGSSGTLPSSQEKNAFNLIDYAIANVTNHTITFYAVIKPTVNLTINVVG